MICSKPNARGAVAAADFIAGTDNANSLSFLPDPFFAVNPSTCLHVQAAAMAGAITLLKGGMFLGREGATKVWCTMPDRWWWWWWRWCFQARGEAENAASDYGYYFREWVVVSVESSGTLAFERWDTKPLQLLHVVSARTTWH